MKKLLVTGKGGQVATEYELSSPVEGWDFFFLDKKELDITKPKHVARAISDVQPDAVLNLAAYTNVEKAEKEETEKAFNANALGPKNLAIECRNRGIPLIHLSTDFVFDGEKEDAYTEKDLENPLNQYGRTKFLGEKWIQENSDWYYILRVSWVYSNHSKNFFSTMVQMAQERHEVNVVDDQFGSPTSAKEICRAIDTVLRRMERDNAGVYHFSGMGKTTWKDFSSEIFSQLKVNVKTNGVSTDSWPSKVTRPKNSYMSSTKFSETFGLNPAHWKNALKEVISERKSIPVKVGDTVILNQQEHLVVSTDWMKRLARIAPTDNLENSIEISFDLLTL